MGVALGGGWGATVAFRAEAESDRLVVRRVHLELIPLIRVGGRAKGETWGFLYDLVGFPIRYVSYCILMYLAVYLDVSRSYTSRYTKIHQDTSRYICIYLFGNVSYLGVFTIHLGYI